MNAMRKNACIDARGYAMAEIEVAAAAHGSGSLPCGRHTGEQQITKMGHGGLRSPAGGRPRSKPKLVEPVPRQTGPQWHVVETYGQAERLAASELTRRGYTVYLPLIAARKQDATIRSVFHKVLVPMFGGYLFVQFDRATTEWVPILHQPGVRGIIRDAETRPMPVPEGFVARLRDTDNERCDLAPETMPRYAPGDEVALMSGPFTSFIGHVLRCDGITTRINVNLFGRLVAVDMARADVRAT